MYWPVVNSKVHKVTPFTGVWIEIFLFLTLTAPNVKSLPSRECGLKLDCIDTVMNKAQLVTPFTGVWIEILLNLILESFKIVTPFTGVWIEISVFYFSCRINNRHSLHGSVDWNFMEAFKKWWNFKGSLPSRECGLK